MPRPKQGERVVLEVESLDGKGRGIAHRDGYTIGVPRALPGDRVVARLRRVRHRRREAEARAESIEHEGIARVPARCPHFGTCGGCTWQDVDYPDQIRLKEQMVVACLSDAGIGVPLEESMVCEDLFFYRNKMEFSFGVSQETGVDLGLHVRGRFDRVFDLEACYLQSEQSNRIVDRVRRLARERGLRAYHLHRHEGLLRFLTVREGKLTGETMVILTTSAEDLPEAGALGELLADEFPGIRSVIRTINSRKAQVAVGDRQEVMAGVSTVRERLGNFTFEISPNSFFQTNTQQAHRLYSRIVELAAPEPGSRALDAYCGTGAISLYLSEWVGEVVGLESSETAVGDAVRNSGNNNVENCQFVCGPAETGIRQLWAQGERFESVVVDPPRPGMHPKALGDLADMGPNRIVYVSCNPQALGSDLRRLENEGYRTDCVQLVDMFPHTPHCEVLARLVR